MPCTLGVLLPERSQMFTRPWQTICSERHFGTPPVRICAVPLSWTGTAHFVYVYRTCTKLGGPVVPYTTSVRLPDRSRMFTRPWHTICSERHFCTAPVRICTGPRSRTGTTHLGYAYTTCTKLGGPVEPCITDVQLQDRSRMFTRPYGKQRVAKGIFVQILYGFVRLS